MATGDTEDGLTRIDREALDALVTDGWLRSQRHPEADLWIYNYTEKTQYENHWTPETMMCRGLIIDADGTIVARPFSKFFNYGTPQAVIPNEPFVVTEKIDGSLGILYYLGGGFRIATRGSFVSEQAREATAMLSEYDFTVEIGTTPLFEIVYPSNRIVVDYGDRRELVLLATLNNETGRETWVKWSGPVAARIDADDIDRLQDLAQANAEGFVVAFESGARVKVKFAEYVRLHKIVTGINARAIWEALKNGDDISSLLHGVPDEIHDWITATKAGLEDAYTNVEMLCADVLTDRPPAADRKTLAGYFAASGANTAVLFRMLDGKTYDDLIWKAIRPGPSVPGPVNTGTAA